MQLACDVLLVDDDPFTRTVLSATIREMGVAQVASVATAAEAMHEARNHVFTLAVLDLDLGEGPTGIDLAHGLRRENARIGLILLSTYAEPRLLGRKQQELPEGTRFVVKQSISDVDALRQVMEAVTANPLLGVETKDSDEALSGLSDLHIEIVRLIAEGKSNSEIARLVIMEEASVEKAIARIIKKLNVKADRTQNQRVMLAQFYFQLTRAPHESRRQ